MLRKPILAVTLSLVITFSLIAFIQLEKNSSLSFSLNTPMVSPVFSNQPIFESAVRTTPSQLMGNSTRTEIYSYVVSNPGIQFRGICAGLGIAVGTAEFHLGVLKKAGLISFVRDGKYKRFFANKKFSVKEMKLISLLRHETTRAILKTIISKKTISHSKLASNLNITSQGLTWQMNRLKEEGIIEEKIDSVKVTYNSNQMYLQILPELLFITEQK
jgi:predicted transcriptional regulator